MMLVNSISE